MSSTNLVGAGAEPFRVFVGYDSREDMAYRVCRRSLLRRSSIPLEITPIVQQELRDAGLYWRERGPTESTEFSFTRFLTPYLAGYHGWALFVDCDFLFVWNFLVGHNRVDPADEAGTAPRAIHYTSGGPWFERYRDCEFADLWVQERDAYEAEEADKDVDGSIQAPPTVVSVEVDA